MHKLTDYAELLGGIPQFRIVETVSGRAPLYNVFGQNDLLEDLFGVESQKKDSKVIRTTEQVTTLSTGNIIFSLISGTACIVSEKHKRYLYTQNYIKISPDSSIDPKFLIYLLNEEEMVRKQLHFGLQGSTTLKYTLKQLKCLDLPMLPSLEKQRLIGDVYLKQLKVQALKCREAKAETKVVLYKLEEVMRNERGSV